MNFNQLQRAIVLTFCNVLPLMSVNFIYAQCSEIDAVFEVSDLTPEIGQEVVFNYSGSLDFCPDCEYLLSAVPTLGGDGVMNVIGSAPFSVGDILAKHLFKNAGSYTVTLSISSDILDCEELSSVTVTVPNPPTPMALFKLDGMLICFPDQEAAEYEIETTDLTGTNFVVTNVAWNMGDSPEIINTAGLSRSHVYASDGLYFITALVTFTNTITSEVLNFEVINIVNRGGVDDFVGSEPFLKAAMMNGDPRFEAILNLTGTGANVDFIYLGTPFPQPGEDIELGWGSVEWTTAFTLGGSPISILPEFEYEVTDQIVPTQELLSGAYSATMTIDWANGVETQCPNTYTLNFIIPEEPCDSCNSFKPEHSKRYWMSAWVKVDEGQTKSYNPNGYESGEIADPEVLEDVYIEFYFTGPNASVYFFPTGAIIDGWQRVVGEFTIPEGTLDLNVILSADEASVTFFDDIRIHPFNGSMKSYVYDGETFWLTSELDDNNYATFYEYDQEGGLVRIKKETSRGIVTIQETKSSTIKD